MKIFPLKLMPDNVNFDFIRIRKLSYFTSITLSLLTFLFIYFHGFNFGIDFVGGINKMRRCKQSLIFLKLEKF